MEPISLPPPRKRRKPLAVFLAADIHEWIVRKALERGEPPGRVAAALIEDRLRGRVESTPAEAS